MKKYLLGLAIIGSLIISPLSGNAQTQTIIAAPTNPAPVAYGPQTLKVGYESRNKESTLTAHFTVRMVAGARGLRVSKDGFIVNFALPKGAPTPDGSYNAKVVAKVSQLSTNGTNGFAPTVDFYIPAGQTSNFDVTAVLPTKDIFGGVYTAKFLEVLVGYEDQIPNTYLVAEDTGSTNRAVVIGETAPYIKSIEGNGVNSPLKIIGTRYSNVMSVLVDDKKIPAQFIAKLNSTTANADRYVSFIPAEYGIPSGSHKIAVVNALGQSNNQYVTLYGELPPQGLTVVEKNLRSIRVNDKTYLTGTFRLKIRAGEKDFRLYGNPALRPQGYSISSVLFQKSDYAYDSFLDKYIPAFKVSGQYSIDNEGIITIPAGKTAEVVVTHGVNVETLFGGAYVASLRGLYTPDTENGIINIPYNETNRVAIVGEKMVSLTETTDGSNNFYYTIKTPGLNPAKLTFSLSCDGDAVAIASKGDNFFCGRTADITGYAVDANGARTITINAVNKSSKEQLMGVKVVALDRNGRSIGGDSDAVTLSPGVIVCPVGTTVSPISKECPPLPNTARADAYGPASLMLTYDSNSKEVTLGGGQYVDVKATTKDVLVVSLGMGMKRIAGEPITPKNGIVPNSARTYFSGIENTTSEQVLGPSGVSLTVWRVKAGQTGRFKLSMTASAQEMFSGTYTEAFNYALALDGTEFVQLPITANDSNAVTIIGEGKVDAKPTVTVTYPNGAQGLIAGSNTPIHWNTTGNLSGTAALFYLTEENYQKGVVRGEGVEPNSTIYIANGAPGYLWNIPTTLSGKYRIFVSYTYSSGPTGGVTYYSDYGDNYFTVSPQTTGTSSVYFFVRNLELGMSGTDVSDLQDFLRAKGFYSDATTGYFGATTKSAVASFEISVGISPADGYFGPIARAYVNSLMYPRATPTITITSPKGGETFWKTATYPIVWKYSGPIPATWDKDNVGNPRVIIDLYKGSNGVFVKHLSASHGGGPAFPFNVTSDIPDGTDYKIRVWTYSDQKYMAESNYFAISTVTGPTPIPTPYVSGTPSPTPSSYPSTYPSTTPRPSTTPTSTPTPTTSSKSTISGAISSFNAGQKATVLDTLNSFLKMLSGR